MKRKFLVIDNGLYCALAEALANDGDDVYYFSPWARPFPEVHDWAKGHGFGKLKKALNFFDHVKTADGIFNFDVPSNDLIHFLRETYPEKCVFGSGRGEKLEHDRVFLKEWLKHAGLPVGPYKVIKGLTALGDYLKNNPHKYIKTNVFREDLESMFFGKWEDDKYLLDERAVTLGMLKEEYEFIVEDPIEAACQSGVDMFFSNGEYVPFSYGFEISKNLCVNKVIRDLDEVPECLLKNMEGLRPLMKRMDYRGPVSTEDRIVDKDTAYLIDFTARVPAPMGQMYPVMIKNWVDVCYGIGMNKPVDIECDHDYIGSFALSSEHAITNNVKIMIDKGHFDDVRLCMVAQNKDGYFAVKGNSVVCCLVAGGKSPKEVLEKIKKASEYVNAYSLDKDPVDGIEKEFEEALEGFESVGLKF